MVRKNQLGFTLVELLAVIVILAIILLIVMPTVLSIVESVRKQTIVFNAEGLASAVRDGCLTANSNQVMTPGMIVINNYEINEELTDTDFDIQYLGILPEAGQVYVNENCEVALAVYEDEWCVTKTFAKQELLIEESTLAMCDITITTNDISIYEVSYYAKEGGSIRPSSRDVFGGGVSLAPSVITEKGYEFLEFSMVAEEYILFENTSTGAVGSVQTWQVPETRDYEIVAYGAQGGGDNGGLGARVSGTFALEKGEVIYILVGQQGEHNNNSSGGGGGSFVVLADETPLLIAGGGGGASEDSYAGRHGQASMEGMDGASWGNSFGVGGSDGEGGSDSNNNGGGAGGGGFLTDGESHAKRAGGTSFLDGGYGGVGDDANGGFGGGAGASTDGVNTGGGAGGGYSGGGGHSGNATTDEAGGGGGSFNADEAGVEESGVNSGHGRVKIYGGFNDFDSETGSVKNVQSDITIYAHFNRLQYEVNYISGDNGSVYPEARFVSHGNNLPVLVVTPDSGYELLSFYVVSGIGNGELNTNTGAITNVTGKMTIRADFIPE